MKKRNLTVMRMLSVTMISAVLSTGISAPLAPVQAVQAAETEQAPGVETNADTPQAREGEVKELTVTAVNETYGSGTQEFTVTVTGEGATVAEGTQRSYQILEGEGVVKAAEGEGAEGKLAF